MKFPKRSIPKIMLENRDHKPLRLPTPMNRFGILMTRLGGPIDIESKIVTHRTFQRQLLDLPSFIIAMLCLCLKGFSKPSGDATIKWNQTVDSLLSKLEA